MSFTDEEATIIEAVCNSAKERTGTIPVLLLLDLKAEDWAKFWPNQKTPPPIEPVYRMTGTRAEVVATVIYTQAYMAKHEERDEPIE